MPSSLIARRLSEALPGDAQQGFQQRFSRFALGPQLKRGVRRHMQTATILTVKAPAECSSVEREDFATLVLAGGEVIADGLKERIETAHALLFLREHSCLVGVAALKNPNATYRASIFKKAGALPSPREYLLELGWVVVLLGTRGKGYSKTLVKAAVAHAGKASIFATSRTENMRMHASLIGASFVKHGNDYASQRGEHQLSLFLRKAPEK